MRSSTSSVIVALVLFAVVPVCGAADVYTSAEVFTHQLVPSPAEYYTTGLSEGTDYAVAGVTEDAFGDPIEPPTNWTYAYGLANGSGDIAGWSRAWAATDELKAQVHLECDKDTNNRVKFRSEASCWYGKTVQFEMPGHPDFWAGTPHEHTVQLEFRVTGNIQENDIDGFGVRSEVHLSLFNSNANPWGEGGEGYGWEGLISHTNAAHNNVDAAGNYDETAVYNYVWADKDWNSGNDYNGEAIPFKLDLRILGSEANIDGMGEGTVDMDFSNTCVLASVSLFEDDGQNPPQLLVTFDAEGNPTGGSQQGDWILIPEPCTLFIASMGAMALLRRRRR